MDRIEEAIEELGEVQSWLAANPATMAREAFRRQGHAIGLLRAELAEREVQCRCDGAIHPDHARPVPPDAAAREG